MNEFAVPITAAVVAIVVIVAIAALLSRRYQHRPAQTTRQITRAKRVRRLVPTNAVRANEDLNVLVRSWETSRFCVRSRELLHLYQASQRIKGITAGDELWRAGFPVEVRSSPGRGLGVFALTVIPEGHLLVFASNTRIASVASSRTGAAYQFLIPGYKGTVVNDMHEEGGANFVRYINSSEGTDENPTVVSEWFGPAMALRSTSRIEPKQELLLDYNWGPSS